MPDSPAHVAPWFSDSALSPTVFLERAGQVYADRVAWLSADRRLTYRELLERAHRLSGALMDLGIQPGDRVSLLAPNTHVAIEAHFGVPMAGAVLNALNSRLHPTELRAIIEHAGSSVLLVDHELADVAREACAGLSVLVIVAGGENGTYEELLHETAPRRIGVEDEWSLLALNYTSGTTGRPKGVMYAHRGAYLQALALAAQTGLSSSSVFLWTLPMFHCNGWCFPWAVTAVGGVHVGLRRIDSEDVWRAIRQDGVTHFNAAPTVLAALAYERWADEGPAPRSVRVATGGSPPSPSLLARLAELRFDVTHLYGLTETYGPAAICEVPRDFAALPAVEQATIKSRQGIPNILGGALRVATPDGTEVPHDGTTMGEVVFRGNNVMLGYYRDPDATASASLDGWFRTGDLGVVHSEGSLELRDRNKDIIITGGENVASIEIEQAIASHPAVLECAVVAAPDERWGEVPVAFVALRAGRSTTEDEVVAHVRSRLARFKVPKQVVFGEIPKTATGKVQKFALRARLWQERSDAISDPDRAAKQAR